MNYMQIDKASVSNGPGIRVVLWVAGCSHRCPGCQNPETWFADAGKSFNYFAEQELFNCLAKPYISGLTFSGGDPLFPDNIKTITQIACECKTKFPTKTIWLWTGYEWPAVKSLEIMNFLDVIVTGPFIESQKDYTLLYCGSRNQQVIDVKASLAVNSIILYKEN